MDTITVKLPEDVAAQLEAERISQEQLDAFLVAALEAWRRRRQWADEAQREPDKRPWSEAFQDSAIDFVDELIDENRPLFEELARL